MWVNFECNILTCDSLIEMLKLAYFAGNEYGV